MAVTVAQLIVQHECDSTPYNRLYARVFIGAVRWTVSKQEALDHHGEAWRYCPYCKAPLAQNQAEAVKAVA